MPRRTQAAGRNRRGRTLGLILASVATGRFPALRRALRAALREGVPRRHVEEVLLMSHLFAGFPRAINAFEAWREAAGPAGAARPGRPAGDRALRRRGGAAFRRVYGGSAPRVLAALAALHPELRERVLADAYGRILSRPGLPVRVRELCAVTALAASGLPRQCLSHVRGALLNGASPAEVRAALAAAARLAPPGLARRLAGQVPDILPRG